ncbi:MAG: radical SAM/SPASM family putative metalloenzyme maturase [Spirochaetota bacterium]
MNIVDCTIVYPADREADAARQATAAARQSAVARAGLRWPSRLVVETSTRCNLACAMCPKQNGCDDGEGGADGDFPEELFQTLAPAFPRLESLVLNGIGEPLLHPQLVDFVRQARAAMPLDSTIGFQTNGLLMDGRRALSLIEAGADRICVSLDALDEGLYAGIRTGGNLSRTLAAIEALGRARTASGKDRARIGIEFVVRRDNLGELPRVVSWAAAHGVDFMLVSQLFPYEKASVEETAYDANLDLALELRAKHEAAGAARGLDITSYPEVYLKYSKTAAEEEIVAMVKDLQAEAIERGISLNLERLFRHDAAMMEDARRVFAEARAIAMAAGLDLALPEAAPKSQRACEFVEGGSAFVSRDGKVHPCYFLWHRYACHVGGWEKLVAPKSFGSLAERGILDIWNDGSFATFRANVLRYEYPFCLNCNLALCDYVQLEDFTQDCHINEEPCAACLWCMGLFRCLY